MKVHVVVVAITCTSLQIAAAIGADASVTLRVADEDGHALSAVETSITFDQPVYKPDVWGSSSVAAHRGRSDAKGLFQASAHSANYVSYSAVLPGYYRSRGQFEFRDVVDGRWQPWNPLRTLILKRIIHPIPLYARAIELILPSVERQIGFDLMVGDWMSPYGHGQNPDLLFALTKQVASPHDFKAELVISFGRPGDGIQSMARDGSGSELKSPHEAPDAGYDAKLVLRKPDAKSRTVDENEQATTGYLLRCRSLLDESGNVKSAIYGKIYGDIEYFPVSYPTAKLRFVYYLNPTPNDHNLEFDPKRNLFTALERNEQVETP